jgi:uncharacterized membrane protein YgcG/uncharacterized membrane protein
MPLLLRPLLFVVLLCVCVTPAAGGGRLDLPRPGDRQFIIDRADLLRPAAERQLQQRCDQLLTDTGVAVGILTLEHTADHGGGGMSLETFTRTLFEDWADKHPLQHGQEWSTGVLLVIAAGDRRARIEPGPRWAESNRESFYRIADEVLRPALRRGRVEPGIVAATAALDDLARGEAGLYARAGAKPYLTWTLAVLLLVAGSVSLVRHGPRGWAGRVLAFSLALPGALLFAITRDRKVTREDELDLVGVSGSWSSASAALSEDWAEPDETLIAAREAAEAATGLAWDIHLVPEAGRYDRAADLAGIALGLLLAGVGGLLLPDLEAGGDSWSGYTPAGKFGLMLLLAGLGFLGGVFFASRCPPLRRLFIGPAERREQVAASARRHHRSTDRHTATIYLSAFERRVMVLIDREAAESIDRRALARLCRSICQGLDTNDSPKALAAALAEWSQTLPSRSEVTDNRPAPRLAG